MGSKYHAKNEAYIIPRMLPQNRFNFIVCGPAERRYESTSHLCSPICNFRMTPTLYYSHGSFKKLVINHLQNSYSLGYKSMILFCVRTDIFTPKVKIFMDQTCTTFDSKLQSWIVCIQYFWIGLSLINLNATISKRNQILTCNAK